MKFPAKLSERMDILEKLRGCGVIVIDPDTAWISPEISIGKGTIIYPNCYLMGDANSSVGENCQIGPGAFLREWFKLGNKVRIGPGAEVVRSSAGDGTKVPHFTHVGDGTVGRNCNIAAGVIFCNFDGERKNDTIVEDDVFIGSGAMLIPSAKRGLRLGAGSFIGAGSIITKDVPPKSLVISDGRKQIVVPNKIVIKENGRWKILSHAEYYADFMNGKPTPPDGV